MDDPHGPSRASTEEKTASPSDVRGSMPPPEPVPLPTWPQQPGSLSVDTLGHRSNSFSSDRSEGFGPQRSRPSSALSSDASPYGQRRSTSSTASRDAWAAARFEQLGFEDEQPPSDEEMMPIPTQQTFLAAPSADDGRLDRELGRLASSARDAPSTASGDRARNAFISAWLTQNYAEVEDGAVSRQGLYASYSNACERLNVRSVNAASFGKLVRATFNGASSHLGSSLTHTVKTRRLGSRKASYYHYCGMAPATMREIQFLSQYRIGASDEPTQLVARTRQRSSFTSEGSGADDEDGEWQPPDTARPALMSFASQQNFRSMSTDFTSFPLPLSYPDLNELPAGALTDVVACRHLWDAYRNLGRGQLDALDKLRADRFEMQTRTFFDSLTPAERALAEHPDIANLMLRADAVIYDDGLQRLSALVGDANGDSNTFQSLRSLADNMENIVVACLSQFTQTFVAAKVELAARFGHLLHRLIGLCQLAQAALGVLGSQTALQPMAQTWAQIDWDSVRNHVALVVNCQHNVLTDIIDQFGTFLTGHTQASPLIALTSWLDATYQRIVDIFATAGGDLSSAARNVLLRATFIASQIMRDITIRSDPTFGSFQLFSIEWISFRTLRQCSLQSSAVHASVGGSDSIQPMQPQTPDQPNLTANYQPIQFEPSYSVVSPPHSARMFADVGYDFGLRTPQATAFFSQPSSLAGVMAASPPMGYRGPTGDFAAMHQPPPMLGSVPGRASFSSIMQSPGYYSPSIVRSPSMPNPTHPAA